MDTSHEVNDSRTLTSDLIPVLQKFDKENRAISDIYVIKNQFTIGRARANDEVICSMVISRHHCILECDENEEWSIKNLSSNGVSINGQSLGQNQSKNVELGDVVQLSAVNDYKYFFTLRFKDDIPAKRRKVEDSIDNSVSRENTFTNYQELKRREMENELSAKKNENERLKSLLNEYSRQQIDDDFIRGERIKCLENTIDSNERIGRVFENTYNCYLAGMNGEREEFEGMMEREKEKLRNKLNVSNEQVEKIIGDEIEKWSRENECNWTEIIKNFMKEERIREEKLERENFKILEKLKRTEDNLRITRETLKEKCEIVEQLQQIQKTSAEEEAKTVKNLTEEIKFSEDNIRDKIENILDDQLSCSICSEILINPTSLNCSHTFCEYCITSWRNKKKNRAKCPICRKKIRSMNRSHVFDSLIDKMISEFSKESVKRRNELIDERKCTR